MVFSPIVLQVGFRFANVLVLRSLVATTEKQDDLVSLLGEVHTVAFSEGQPQFTDSGTNRLHITKVPQRYSVEPGGNPGKRDLVLKAIQPFIEWSFAVRGFIGAKLFRRCSHLSEVSIWILNVKFFLQGRRSIGFKI
jgi:hypothetical protein